MRITRRESLHRLVRLAAIAPLGMVAACMDESGASVEEAELGLTQAGEDVALAELEPEADVVIEVDPETAEKHFAAMKRCLREQGIDVPDKGPFKVRLHRPPSSSDEHAGERVKYIVRAGKPGAPLDAPEGANPVFIQHDERTAAAMQACAAQVGPPPGLAAR